MTPRAAHPDYRGRTVNQETQHARGRPPDPEPYIRP